MSVVTPDLVLSGLAVAAAAGTELEWLSSPPTLSWWSGASCELFLLGGGRAPPGTFSVLGGKGSNSPSHSSRSRLQVVTSRLSELQNTIACPPSPGENKQKTSIDLI